MSNQQLILHVKFLHIDINLFLTEKKALAFILSLTNI